MGEAKRRKAYDQTSGHAKRGLVVSPPIEIHGSSVNIKKSQLDPQELRFSLLFWDRLVWPSSRAIRMASGPDEVFLERSGVLTRPEMPISGDIAQSVAQSQIQAFLALDRAEPGAWSLAQGENSLLIKDGVLHEGNGAFVELHRAIPVPQHDVSLDDILQFRVQRYPELTALRTALDDFIKDLNAAGAGSLPECVSKVDAACADALKVSKEWRFPVRLANVKASLDLRPFASIAAGVLGWEVGATYGMPLASALLFGAGASFKIGGDFGVQGIRPRQGPYRYVARIHQELL